MSPSPSAPSFSVLGILTLVGSIVAAAAFGATAGVLSAKRASQAHMSLSAGTDLEDDANSTPVRAAAKRPKRSAETAAVSGGSATTYQDATPSRNTREPDRVRRTADERKRRAVSTTPAAELDEELPTPGAPADEVAENGATDEELDAPSGTDEVPEQPTDAAPVDETTGGDSSDEETSGEDTTSGETTADGTSGETAPDDGTEGGDTGEGGAGSGGQAGRADRAGGASTGDGGVAGTVSG